MVLDERFALSHLSVLGSKPSASAVPPIEQTLEIQVGRAPTTTILQTVPYLLRDLDRKLVRWSRVARPIPTRGDRVTAGCLSFQPPTHVKQSGRRDGIRTR